MNSYVKLAQSTTNVILHISTEFQGHFSWCKRVIWMNPRVYSIQSTAKVILHIATEFQEDLFEMKELLE